MSRSLYISYYNYAKYWINQYVAEASSYRSGSEKKER